MDEVILRRWSKKEGGSVIAIFPYQISDSDGNVNSYEHIGQHGGASLGLVSITTAVKETDPDAKDLLAELRGRGYKPKVIQRVQHDKYLKALHKTTTEGYKASGADKHIAEPYAGEVRYFVDEKAKAAVPTWVGEEQQKGWYNVLVGGFKAKARHPDIIAVRNTLLKTHYPTHTKEANFWIDTSYHSPLNLKGVNKITTYGTDPRHHIDFNRVKAVATYRLLHPVKAEVKGGFGKKKEKITSYIWRYLVLNWEPAGDHRTKWFVTESVHYPDGRVAVVFESPKLDDPEKAREIFMKRLPETKKAPMEMGQTGGYKSPSRMYYQCGTCGFVHDQGEKWGKDCPACASKEGQKSIGKFSGVDDAMRHVYKKGERGQRTFGYKAPEGSGPGEGSRNQPFYYGGYTYDGGCYCPKHLPKGVKPDGEGTHPIFADSEWDYTPSCDVCHKKFDYVQLTSEGRRFEAETGGYKKAGRLEGDIENASGIIAGATGSAETAIRNVTSGHKPGALTQGLATVKQRVKQLDYLQGRSHQGRERFAIIAELAKAGYRYLGDDRDKGPDDWMVKRFNMTGVKKIPLKSKNDTFEVWVGIPHGPEAKEELERLSMVNEKDKLPPIEHESLPPQFIKQYVKKGAAEDKLSGRLHVSVEKAKDKSLAPHPTALRPRPRRVMPSSGPTLLTRGGGRIKMHKKSVLKRRGS